MIKNIGTSGAFYGGGISTQKKLFIVPFGPYQGRAIVVFQKTSSQVVFVWADPPYTEWSSETEIVSDSADYPPSAHMDEAGNVYMAYTVVDSLDLAELKLTFSDGNWSVGTKNTVYNGDSNYFPSILKDKFGRLWISWSRVLGENCYVNSKRSSDDGSTWGSGPSDEGTTLTSGASLCFSQIVYRPDHIYVIYTEDGTKLAYRRMSTSGAIFDDEVTLYLGTELGSGFSGASSCVDTGFIGPYRNRLGEHPES